MAIGLGVCVAPTGAASAADPASAYTFVDLGAGFRPGGARSVNANDWIAGTDANGFGAVWHSGIVTELIGAGGEAQGQNTARAGAINDSGQVAGVMNRGKEGIANAAWWNAPWDGVAHLVDDTEGLAMDHSFAGGINNSGTMVEYQTMHGDSYGFQTSTTENTTAGIGSGVRPSGISDDGHILALVGDQWTLLGGPNGDGGELSFTAIPGLTHDGRVLGSIYAGTDTATTVIRDPDGAQHNYTTALFPSGMNDSNVVVGLIKNGTPSRAAVLHDGTVTDLNAYAPAGVTLQQALAINNQGDIVGVADQGGVQHGFLLEAPRAIVVNSTTDHAEVGSAAPGVCDTSYKLDGDVVECTLRAALKVVNDGGATSVEFNIPGGGVPTISPATPLPPTTANVRLDAATQPGGWVQLSGTSGIDAPGLEVDAGTAIIRGFVLNGWTKQSAIDVKGGSGTLIAGDRIGTDPTGTTTMRNLEGVLVEAPGVTIGGSSGTSSTACTGDCDLISGNGANGHGVQAGIHVLTKGAATVLGDYIGTDVTGLQAVPNDYGIIDDTVGDETPGHLTIGGATATPGTAPGNLISGNSASAIVLAGRHDTVAGNLIGEDRTGSRGLQPAGAEDAPIDGIDVLSNDGTVTIGGPVPLDRNVIGGFARYGVQRYEGHDGNVIVQNDRIGTSLDGTAAVPNGTGTLGVQVVKDSLISGNTTWGIDGADLVTGNLIGTTADGESALPNQAGVIRSRQVGGERAPGVLTCAAPCNVVSGNVDGAISGTEIVQGNFIGTDIKGLKAIPNGHPGSPQAAVQGFSQLGGWSGAVAHHECDRACNLISGNATVAVEGGDKAFGNIIGATSVGMGSLPNQGPGIKAAHYEEPLIGGDGGLGNVIADNTGPAVEVFSGSPTIQGNMMLGNSDGIVFDPTVTARIPARPIATSAVVSAGDLTVSGEVTDLVSSDVFTARVDAYANTSCASGPQGYLPLGHVSIGPITDGSWTLKVPRPDAYLQNITVTSTEAGMTSAFSSCVTVSSASTITPQPGQKDSVQAPGFSNGEKVDVTLHSNPRHLVTVTAGSAGIASARVTIPKSTPAGAHHLIFTGAKSKHVVSLAITVTPAPQAGLLRLLAPKQIAHKRLRSHASITLAGHAGLPRKGARHALVLVSSTVAAHVDGHAIPAHGSALLVIPPAKATVTVQRPGSVTLTALGWYASAKSTTGNVLRTVHPAAVRQNGTQVIAGTRGLPFTGVHAVVLVVHTKKAASTLGGVRLAKSKNAQTLIARVTGGKLAVHLGRGATAAITGWYGAPDAAPGGRTTG